MTSEHRYPEGSVLYRRLKRSYPQIVRGEGCWLYDDRGGRYLDGCGGALVTCLGHGVREVAEAMGEQAARVAYVNGTVFTSEPVETLAAELARLDPPGVDKAMFVCNGGDAIEAALKMARQFWAECGRPSKRRLIALAPSYHGNTLLAMSVSARPHYRKVFQDWLVDVTTIPAPYAYRCPCGGARDDCPACSGTALEEAILAEGPEHVAAFVAEPVGGSSTGASVPRPGYFERVRAICDRHEVLFVADEVMVGAGRTGTWSALAPSGVSPDFLTLGKGITGGYAPLAAVVTTRRVADVIARGSGAPLHNQTFSQHAVSCAAGVATLRLMRERKLVERCAHMGELLHVRLRELLALPHVGDVRGRGLFAGVEFVADKATREPLPRELAFAESFADQALAAGLLVWPNHGMADGERGDLVLLGPPFVIDEGELDELVRRFRTALEKTLEAVEGRA